MAQVVMTIDRNEDHARTLEKHIRQEMAMGTVRMQSAGDALRHVVSGIEPQPDVILMDLGMESTTLDVLRALHSLRPDMQVIMLASHASVDMAMAALTEGAADFLLMPFHPAQLTSSIRNALIRRDLQIEARHAWANERIALEDFKAESASLGATLFLARKLADTDAPLILEGAPGTGRELFARAIHGSSTRRDAPFVAANVSVFLQEEIAPRLFGDARVQGLLAKAQGGSLLLRNIDALSEKMQRRLLSVLKGDAPMRDDYPQERFNGRVMFAVQDAARRANATAEQQHVAHLFSQLNALPVSIPYLRDIPEDIPFLATQLCRRYAALEGKAILGISPAATQMLREISWPGNMEQLALGIFNAVMCCEGSELQVSDFRYLFRPQSATVSPLPAVLPDVEEGAEPPTANIPNEGVLRCVDTKGNVKRLQDMEQEMIRYALERYSGHMSAVARHLGIGRSTLYRKISTMGDK